MLSSRVGSWLVVTFATTSSSARTTSRSARVAACGYRVAKAARISAGSLRVV